MPGFFKRSVCNSFTNFSQFLLLHSYAHVRCWPSNCSQAIQIRSDGLRNGHMGDDQPTDSTEEGVQVNLLSRSQAPTPVLSCRASLTSFTPETYFNP